MGNNCVGPQLGGNGFLQSVSAAFVRKNPLDKIIPSPDCDADDNENDTDAGKNPAIVDLGSSKDSSAPKDSNPPGPNNSVPPETVKIPNGEPKPPEPEKAAKPEVNDPPSDTGDTANAKKTTHHRRVSSVGLQVESVLGRKTKNLKDVYSVGRKLGQGQFGTTFFCLEKTTGKEFACKTIVKRKLSTLEDVEDVRREIQIMHHLAGHPNVIQIVGAYEDAVAVNVVMEFCCGGELFDRIIQRGHYTEKKAAQLARVIVHVVEACHSLGVMHRDLKPENFLFVNQEEDSLLKAIDFGLSVFFKPGIFTISRSLVLRIVLCLR